VPDLRKGKKLHPLQGMCAEKRGGCRGDGKKRVGLTLLNAYQLGDRKGQDNSLYADLEKRWRACRVRGKGGEERGLLPLGGLIPAESRGEVIFLNGGGYSVARCEEKKGVSHEGERKKLAVESKRRRPGRGSFLVIIFCTRQRLFNWETGGNN